MIFPVLVVFVCDLETSTMRRTKPESACCATGEKRSYKTNDTERHDTSSASSDFPEYGQCIIFETSYNLVGEGEGVNFPLLKDPVLLRASADDLYKNSCTT